MRFENVYFITGTAYAGKSTMVHLLAEKHGGIECEENYHDRLLPGLDKEEFPALTWSRDLEDWHEFIRRTPEAYEAWIGGSGIMMAVENTDGFRDYEKVAIAYLLESPEFGLTWDIGHSKAIREADISFLMEHQDKLIHFHIHDGTETPPRNHLALGDGEIDLDARLKLAAERNARCVLETKTISALKQSVRWLRNNWEGSRWA